MAPAQYRGERAYEQQLALLLAQTPYANERGIRGEGRAIHIEEARIEPAVHDVHLRPLGGVDPAIHLAAPERADGHDEGGTLRLFGQADELSLVELLRPVHRKAVGRTAEAKGQHRHFGRIGPEVRVQVVDRGKPRPARHDARFGKVDQVVSQRSLCPAAHAHRGAQCRDEQTWSRGGRATDRPHEAKGAFA